MRLLPIVLISLLAIGSGVLLFNSLKKVKTVPSHVIAEYARWKKRFGKLYQTPSENDFRLHTFHGSLTDIESYNSNYNEFVAKNNLPPLSGPMFALQKHSDLTKEEFKKKYTGLKMPEHIEVAIPTGREFEHIKKRTNLGQGYDTRIRNQQSCGSCWAFATVAAVEKYYWDYNAAQIDFSTQDLVNCVTDGCNGCDGGWPTNALTYIKDNGIATASSLPYTSSAASCTTDTSSRIQMGSSFSGLQLPWTLTLAQNANAVGVYGAIVVYSSGAFQSLSTTDDIWYAASAGECSNQVDHAITEIGAGSNYVRVMNSWDTAWGFQGTKKIAPCSASNINGDGAYFMHPYSDKNL